MADPANTPEIVYGHIYLIEAHGVHKIGSSRKDLIDKRVRSLNPNSVRAVSPCSSGFREMEQALHHQFRHYRLQQSEWFVLNEGQVEQVAYQLMKAPPMSLSPSGFTRAWVLRQFGGVNYSLDFDLESFIREETAPTGRTKLSWRDQRILHYQYARLLGRDPRTTDFADVCSLGTTLALKRFSIPEALELQALGVWQSTSHWLSAEELDQLRQQHLPAKNPLPVPLPVPASA